MHAILKSAKPPSKTEKEKYVVSAVDGLDLFHSAEDRCYASFQRNGHRETWPIESRSFRDFITKEYYDKTGEIPSEQSVKNALNLLNGQALFEGPELQIGIRLAENTGSIFLDLADNDWNVVRIDRRGYHVIAASDCPVRFVRTKSMRPLPMPTGQGDIDDLREFLNLSDASGDAYTLIKAWLVNCLRPGFPYPILIFTGEPGTAKSTTTERLKNLVDPSELSHRSSPRNESDLMIAATRSHLLAFDNISSIPDWLSDAYCRLSTGGGIGTRTLYTNDEETILKAKRPIILNGIGSIATRSDLLDRAIVIELRPISHDERRSERELKADFESKIGSIFDALLSAVSVALNKIESIQLPSLERMADFAQWGTAAEEGLSIEPGGFIQAYRRSRESVHDDVLEGSPVGEVLREYCSVRGAFDEVMLIKDILSALKNLAGDMSLHKDFPKSSRGLRNQLLR
ncbi:MAG: hypothetical protein AAB288_01050, partial [Acidobacteriota bacterium]